MKIFILAGGFGTRLKNVLFDVPKPMAPIHDKPFLDYQIQNIKKYFPNENIYLLTHYMSSVIEEYYKDDNSIKIIKENEPLGTGGSIKNAISELELKNDEKLLIFNGDTYIEANLNEFIELSENINIISSMQKDCSRYGTLTLKNNHIAAFNEKVYNSKNKYINVGCYYFKNLDFFVNIQKKIFAIEDEFKKYLDNNGEIYAYKYKGVFIDIGIPQDYKKLISYIGKNSE